MDRNSIIGQKFNMLTVVGIAPTPEHIKDRRALYVFCDCDCGTKNVVKCYGNIKSGATKSCGCEYHKVGKRYKENTYEFKENYVIGYDFKNRPFYFSAEDFDIVSQYTWYVNEARNNEVANAANGIKLHRLILNMNDSDLLVDHINHNKNDNRRENLRPATPHENGLNKTIRSDNQTGVRGVNKSYGKYVAYIRLDGKKKHIGTYDTIEEATQARLDAEQKYYGEWSYDNSMKISQEYAIENNIII